MSIRGPYEQQLEQETSIDGTFYESLDEALMICEDKIIAKYDKRLLRRALTTFREEDEEVKEITQILDEKFLEADFDMFSEIIKYFKRCA